MSECVLVTGASAGIGLELARLFAADGSDLVLVARRQERLAQLARELGERHGVAVEVIAADLADAAAPGQIADALQARGLAVDVLVNNAGFGAGGTFVRIERQRLLDMIQVNIAALTDLTHRLLPDMIERGRGGVLNVGSTAAFQPGPNMAVYFATKAYVLSLSEALADELRGSGVTVSCLAPGATRTEFADVAGLDGARLFRMAMSAEAVARAGYRGFRRGRLLVVPGVHNWLGAFAVRLMPRWVPRRIAATLHRK